VITTWRSGSTITFNLLASHPQAFAINEPLIKFGLEHLTLKTDKLYDAQVQLVKEQMNCNLKSTHYGRFFNLFLPCVSGNNFN
jgi:hypothetical protein